MLRNALPAMYRPSAIPTGTRRIQSPAENGGLASGVLIVSAVTLSASVLGVYLVWLNLREAREITRHAKREADTTEAAFWKPAEGRGLRFMLRRVMAE